MGPETWLVLLLSAALGQTSTASKPEELVYLEHYRQSIDDALVEWKRVDRYGTAFETAKISGKDYLQVQHGDEDGLQYEKKPGDPYCYSNRYAMVKDDRFWRYVEESGAMHRNGLDRLEPMYDVRTFGMHPRLLTRRSPSDIVPAGALFYGVSQTPDGLREITAEYDGGQYKWWLDPAKDFAPVRSASIADGQTVSESVTTYRDHGGVWFPERVEYYREGQLDGTIEVQSTSFNVMGTSGLDAGRELGLIPGVNVMEGVGQPVKLWDGKNAVDVAEFDERRAKGEIDTGEYDDYVRRIQAGYVPGTAVGRMVLEASKVGRDCGLWEAYTRQFMHEHKFTADERQAGWRLLRKCQDRAYDYLKTRKSEFRDADERLSQATQDKDAARVERLKEEREKLLVPVADIFERDLDPGLHRMVERRERQSDAEGKVK